MAKSFNDTEKELIRITLIEKGREFFAQYGLKKTSIEELTKAAGISQGSFYVFYNSKEELYFEILEAEEERLTDTLRNLFNSNKLTKESFKRFLEKYFELVHGNPFIENLIRHKEYELMIRKLPEEKKQKHMQNESWIFNNAVLPLQNTGSFKKVKPEVLSGLFHALFLLQLHKKELGETIFPEIMNLMTELITEGLVISE